MFPLSLSCYNCLLCVAGGELRNCVCSLLSTDKQELRGQFRSGRAKKSGQDKPVLGFTVPHLSCICTTPCLFWSPNKISPSEKVGRALAAFPVKIVYFCLMDGSPNAMESKSWISNLITELSVSRNSFISFTNRCCVIRSWHFQHELYLIGWANHQLCLNRVNRGEWLWRPANFRGRTLC